MSAYHRDRISNKGASDIEEADRGAASLGKLRSQDRVESPQDMFWTVTRSRVPKKESDSEQSTMQHSRSQILHHQDSRFTQSGFSFYTVRQTVTQSGFIPHSRYTTTICLFRIVRVACVSYTFTGGSSLRHTPPSRWREAVALSTIPPS